MDLMDTLKDISDTIPKQREIIKTEEATKNALIMPFINALGYNVFDPSEVVPEFTADVGNKQGEKVDYAIMIDGNPIILIEAKSINTELDIKHASQLFRYFNSTEARFGILTNGIIYRFYTDIEKPNTMDEKPFLEINLQEINEPLINELKKFTKSSSFDLDEILSTASELKYTREIKQILNRELEDPSDEFVKYFAKQVYKGVLTPRLKEKFSGITKRALNQFIKEQVSSRLKLALEASHEKPAEKTEEKTTPIHEIITTENEWEGFYVIKGILCDVVDIERVKIKTTTRYCTINLDHSRKPICHLHFKTKQKHLGVYDENKKEQKIPIENVNELYKFADKLKERVNIMELN